MQCKWAECSWWDLIQGPYGRWDGQLLGLPHTIPYYKTTADPSLYAMRPYTIQRKDFIYVVTLQQSLYLNSKLLHRLSKARTAELSNFQTKTKLSQHFLYLVIVMHLVLESPVVTAFSNSSRPPVFFSFFTKLLTAFSDHLSSFSPSPFLQAKSRLTIGGVNGENCVIFLSAPGAHERRKLSFVYLNRCFNIRSTKICSILPIIVLSQP